MGWGTTRHMLADIFDAINLNTKATGQWKKKPPEFPEWPRPTREATKPKKAVTVADIYARFTSRR